MPLSSSKKGKFISTISHGHTVVKFDKNFKVRKLTQSYDINACIQNTKDQAPIYLHVYLTTHTHTGPQASPNIKSYQYANTNFHT